MLMNWTISQENIVLHEWAERVGSFPGRWSWNVEHVPWCLAATQDP